VGEPPPNAAPSEIDKVVSELAAEAHVSLEALPSQERDYLRQHALKKPLRALDVWALGVGVVITGAYFGWNLGLKDNGPVAMLVASLIVCLLYVTWALALTELSVAMPFAGGPLAYGRRAFGPPVGFVMAWSMFLECQFAAIATAVATGGYVAFLFNPDQPDPTVRLIFSLAAVVIFFLLQALGAKEQSILMVVMTYGAILGLILFIAMAAPSFSWARVWPHPLFPPELGWMAVLRAVPYALWWLVMIETVALAAEEAHEPHKTLPRGLVWAQLTLVVLVVLTWLFACGAVDSKDLASTATTDELGQPVLEDVDYPLAKAVRILPMGRQSPLLLWGFGGVAIFGMIASYHGMVYGTSRQLFALGRAGYLPSILGQVHASRRTPIPALLTCSGITAAFVVANYWFKSAVDLAVLVSTLTALVWYILAIGCLLVLRRREPKLFSAYRAPLLRVLPLTVVVLSAFALYFYSTLQSQVLPLTAALYVGAIGYYWFWARKRLQAAAPEEVAARHPSEAVA
jgi:ethanolamine permease